MPFVLLHQSFTSLALITAWRTHLAPKKPNEKLRWHEQDLYADHHKAKGKIHTLQKQIIM